MATTKSRPTSARGSTLNNPMRSRRWLRFLIGLVLLITVVGFSVAITWLLTTRYHKQSNQEMLSPAIAGQNPLAAPPPALEPAAPIFVPVEPFTIMLNEGDDERMLHVAFTLRVGDDISRQRLEKYMPEVRNRVLLLLSTQTLKNLQTAQGKMDLAKAILTSVNRPFAPIPYGQAVTDVLFTAFVVQ